MRHLTKFILVGLIVLAWPVSAEAAFSEYEVEKATASLSTYQAGAHADFTTSFKLKAELEGGDVVQTRDVRIGLPPGLLGDPSSFPRCTMPQLVGEAAPGHCPQDSQIGITVLELQDRATPLRQPVYNMASPGGDVVARFGFMASLFFPATINVRLRSDSDYGVTASVEGASGLVGLIGASTTIWGVPTDSSHDLDRITPNEGENNSGPPGGRPSELAPTPFLSNPTRCGVPLDVSFSADSYQLPQAVSTKTATLPPLNGCGKLDFSPRLTTSPTTREAAAPTGLDVDLNFPQDQSPQGRATAQLEDARVTLPEGMTLAAGAADGLGSCSADQVGYKSLQPARCPDSSKLGTVELEVVGLERPVQGALYQRDPAPGHLFRVWIAADDLGVHVALPGDIEVDPATGRITTSFLENPQVSLKAVRLHIFGGARGPLSTPASCGNYSVSWGMGSWAGSMASGNSPLEINQGCSTGGFDPRLSAGSVDADAGSFSPFVFDLSRDSQDENISRLDVELPPGLLAKLAGVPLCEGTAAGNGDCPESSRIGAVSIAAGPGSAPLWIPQPGKQPTAIYLGGPFDGAPYSMIIKVPAQAGPFDLGTVVVRSAIRVDPETARVSIDSPPLPQLLEGVPVSYRRIRAEIDRNHFMINPTNCDPLRVTANVFGIGGANAKPASRFQAVNCRALKYSPKLKLKLKGGTNRNQHPALLATFTQGPGQANNAAISTLLPASEIIDQSHINNPCTRVEFAANDCPRDSVLGRAAAVSPLLDSPLKGPVYFRSNGGARTLPDIVVDLHGSLHIILVGYVDSVVKKGTEISRIRTRFLHVPDAAVHKFTLKLFGGERGLLVNSANLCRQPVAARLQLRAQNGSLKRASRRLQTPCPGTSKPQPG